MIINGMWDDLYLPGPLNKEKKWDLFLHQSRFPLEYVKYHVNSLYKISRADYYVVQNLMWSGVYMGITSSTPIEGTHIVAADRNQT